MESTFSFRTIFETSCHHSLKTLSNLTKPLFFAWLGDPSEMFSVGNTNQIPKQ